MKINIPFIVVLLFFTLSSQSQTLVGSYVWDPTSAPSWSFTANPGKCYMLKVIGWRGDCTAPNGCYADAYYKFDFSTGLLISLVGNWWTNSPEFASLAPVPLPYDPTHIYYYYYKVCDGFSHTMSLDYSDANWGNNSGQMTFEWYELPCDTVSIASNVKCVNSSATVTLSGGLSPYTYSYSWNTSPVQNTQTATGLSAGAYTVAITDNMGCTYTQTVSIASVNGGTVTIASQTDVLCNGGSTGTATATMNGGTSPFTYNWTSGQTTSSITNFSAGNFSVTVTDANGCITTQTVTITEPALLTAIATATNIDCTNPTATATVTPNGGTGTYTYNWNPSGQTTPIATGLGAGNYSVTVTDANGCTVTQTVAVTSVISTLSVSATSTQAGCTINNGTATAIAGGGASPYTYNWSNGQSTQIATGLAAGNYTVTVADANGCTQTQTVTVTSSSAFTVNASSASPVICASATGSASAFASGGTSPYAYLWNPSAQTSQTATGLAAGNYSVEVTDGNGCTQTQTVTVTSFNPLSLTGTFTQTQCLINNGTATATPNNGTAPYSYLWSNGQTTQTATGLAAGNYSTIVTDANGCTKFQIMNVTQTPGPTAVVTAAAVNITLGGNTQLTAAGGGTYQWSPAAGLSCTTCANPIATPSSTTSYCVFITDGNGCTDSDCITINVEIPCGVIFMPNAFSPNGDGEDDSLCIYTYNISCITDFKITIWDRWGEKVFQSINPDFRWDGSDNTGLLKGPEGIAVFVYRMQIKLIGDTKIDRKGNVSLIR
ncbi:MAG: hypothetical protein EPN85_05695 [Bacteroidetes bacterium]|nr:MAG: hypothetical protein EPN85_05695 [Bacteroidota bacterium]